MSVTAAIRKMIEAGLTVEQALVAAEAFESHAEPARSAGAERTRRWRERKASQVTSQASHGVTVTDVTSQEETLPSPEERKVSPCTPSKETLPLPSRPSATPRANSAREADFARFWQAYPCKVGKGAAQKSFLKATAANPGLTVEILLSAIQAYIRNKPPDRDFCHPATWLNQGRWNDEWNGNHQRQHRPASGADNVFAAMDELLGGGDGRGGGTPMSPGFDDAERDAAGVYRIPH